MMPKRMMSLAVLGLAVLSLGKAGDVIARSENVMGRTARQTADEFGAHRRPWARDLLAESSTDAQAAQSSDAATAAAATCSYLDTLDAAIARAYIEPVETMRALDQERERLKTEARSVQDARALAEATIIRAEQEVKQLSVLRRDIQALLTTLETESQADIDRMRSLYETMKPKAAAEILKSMDIQIIVEILEDMPDRRAAPILSALPVDLSRSVMRVFAERRRPPPT
ncbi:MAG: MotE family protein [Alphaproteobacteria bacterium]